MKKLLLSILLITSALLSFGQQQFDYQAHSTNGSDTYTVNVTNATAYETTTSPVRGIGFSIIFDTSSSGACTLNVNGLGAITINGSITANTVYRLEYNIVTDQFDMISGGGSGSGTVNSGTAGQLAYYAGTGDAVSGTNAGTGVITALGVNIGSAGAPVLFDGAGGTPSSVTLTNATGFPYATGGTGIVPAANGGAGTVNGLLKANGSGLVSTGVLGTDYFASGANTLSAATSITGTTTNTIKHNFDGLTTVITNGAGLWIANNTAATISQDQYSPTLILEGQGWKSNATAASQSVRMGLHLAAVTSSSAPIGQLRIVSSINGGAYTSPIVFTSAGSVSATTYTLPNQQSLTSGSNGLIFTGVSSTANPIFRFTSPVYTNTSGTLVYTQIGNATGGLTVASGTADYRHLVLDPLFNVTGSYSGTLTNLYINATETSLNGRPYYSIIDPSTTGLRGFATATPVSSVDIDGSMGLDITSTSIDITAGVTHHTILVDASGAARTITLPAASGATRRMYRVKKTDATANNVTIDGNASETIDGATTLVFNTQYSGYVIQCDGSNWYVIGAF